MFKHITLTLARCPDFPLGSSKHGYVITAPLDADGYLDTDACKTAQSLCLARRFSPDEKDRFGRLLHRPGGPNGATWVIDYDPNATSDDERGFRLETHQFVPGNYVSIRDDEGKVTTYQVARVSDA
ncbi:hypothetical protein PY365_23435 [Roseiarcaceae bacterium H3SJ34-1]|uniref:hypothetical protein n=1 Tax=Terripilifer ovatus TaxID=3032367 RepID=UPI003AB9A639|nr:hypothetical protein [Roseiarcaceae bacterium H3SJ34-1]